MSKVQRKIWHIAWDMWNHRNSILHNEGKSIHKKELEALNSAIISELRRGKETLPAIHHQLFNCNIKERLRDTFQFKRLWLSSVWSARDAKNGIKIEKKKRDPIAMDFYIRWRKRLRL